MNPSNFDGPSGAGTSGEANATSSASVPLVTPNQPFGAATATETLPSDGPDRSSVDAYYNSVISPMVDIFEEKRQAAVAVYRARLGPTIGAALGIVALWGYFIFGYAPNFFADASPFWFGGAAVLAAVGSYFYITWPLSDYTDEVRGDIYPKIFGFFGDNFIYRRDCPWSVDALERSDLIPSYDSENLEDYVRGSHNGVTIEMLEVELTEQQGSGKSRRTVTKFDGLFFILTPKKKFEGRIVVRRDSGAIGNAFLGFFKDKFTDLETVRLEDPEFERKFEVYATDQITARTILTTSFMQRLLDLGAVIGNDDVDCSFFSDRLLIRAATSKNYFEPQSALKPVDFRKDFTTVVEEMRIVFDIVETLKLDQDIGL